MYISSLFPFVSLTPLPENKAAARGSVRCVGGQAINPPMCCCCCGLHRHQIHLISYAFVSLGLLATGFVFTIFSIFYKDSQIGKVWLAGPTTMVVGLVLCGKGANPVMQRLANNGGMAPNGRHFGSFTPSQDGYQKALIIPNNAAKQSNGSISAPSGSGSPGGLHIPPQVTAYHQQKVPNAETCLMYSQYEPPLSNLNSTPIGMRLSHAKLEQSPRGSVTSPAVSEICECAKYGTIRRPANLYQGESFVLNDRNYLI
ncbi:unnamed protein product, partial [Mesorhabditis spiculigera]